MSAILNAVEIRQLTGPFQISNKAKMASYVELLKLPIQCHQCLAIVQGGPDGMPDHLYQVHETTAYYPKEYTW